MFPIQTRNVRSISGSIRSIKPDGGVDRKEPILGNFKLLAYPVK